MPRRARLDAPGVLQHVMARGIEQRDIFSAEEDYAFFTNRLGKLLNETGTDCFAWALVQNHFHLLLRIGPTPLPTLMQRLLTSYSVYYNQRYRRSGHLFQNRYKSILCEEDPYLLELVRYIHLNPIRIGIVTDLSGLARHPWCGDGALMGRCRISWQSTNEVLGYFDRRVGKARLKYREFLQRGLSQGRRPELVGGLSRSIEGRDQLSLSDREELCDQRILGGTEFVKLVLGRRKESEPVKALRISWTDLLKKVSEWSGIPAGELVSGGKQRTLASARAVLSYLAVRKAGMKATEVAHLLKVSQPAISMALLKGEEIVKVNRGVFDAILDKL